MQAHEAGVRCQSAPKAIDRGGDVAIRDACDESFAARVMRMSEIATGIFQHEWE